MGVTLRVNKKESGVQSLYLDITANGKRYKEYLGISLKPARTPEARAHNKEKRQLAESIRAKRELELQARDYEITPRFKKNVDFIEYYANFLAEYSHKDIRVVKYSYTWFVKYLKKQKRTTLKPNELDEKLCKGFYDYLQKNLNGETPYNYYTKFKRVVAQAINDELMFKNPTANVKIVRDEGLKKEILSYDEIGILAKAHCPNNEVKRAFLFSLYTGLRWCDVAELTFSNLDIANQKLRYTQAKTRATSKNATNTIDLSPMLLKLIGNTLQEPKAKIFNLPSHTGALKILKAWVANAGITKNITWHCARHSFAVNQLSEQKTDIKTVADLLGHAGLKYVERYSRVIDEKKAQAIQNQPEVEF